jgi:hypothetical protein
MRTLVVIGATVLLGVTSTVAADQRLAMMRAEWGDHETWSHYIQDSQQNELGLGLHVAGPTGTSFLAFTGRLGVRNPTEPPREIGVQIAAGRLSNPTVVRRATLVFLADAGETDAFRLDLSERLNVDDPTPGGSAENGVAMMRAVDFVRLSSATTLMVDVLGFEGELRDDQIRAVRTFAGRLHLIPSDD